MACSCPGEWDGGSSLHTSKNETQQSCKQNENRINSMRSSRNLRGARVHLPDAMVLRINRTFRVMLQNGNPSEILSICDKAGKQLNISNVAAALQMMAHSAENVDEFV